MRLRRSRKRDIVVIEQLADAMRFVDLKEVVGERYVQAAATNEAGVSAQDFRLS